MAGLSFGQAGPGPDSPKTIIGKTPAPDLSRRLVISPPHSPYVHVIAGESLTSLARQVLAKSAPEKVALRDLDSAKEAGYIFVLDGYQYRWNGNSIYDLGGKVAFKDSLNRLGMMSKFVDEWTKLKAAQVGPNECLIGSVSFLNSVLEDDLSVNPGALDLKRLEQKTSK